MFREIFLEIFIAVRYLRGHGRTVIFGPGIRLSFFFMSLMVFILVLVLSVFNGFEHEIHELLKSSANHITITRANSVAPIDKHNEILANYAIDPDLRPLIRTAYASISVNALLGIGNRFEGKSIRAIPLEGRPADLRAYRHYPPLVHYRLEHLKRFRGGNYILVGRSLARHHGWQVGDRIRIFLPRGGSIARGMQIRQDYFTIAGFFRTGFNEFDQNIIYMSLETAQRIVGLRNRVNEIIVQLHELSRLDAARNLVRERIPDNPYYYSITTIREERGNFLAAVKLEKTLMVIVLGLLILAGVAGIWVTVYLLVKEKTQSIGMLRAMGLPMRSVNVIFTANAMLIGLISTALGGSIGIYVTNRLAAIIKLSEDVANTFCEWFFRSCTPIKLVPDNIYYFDYLPVQADPSVIFGVALVTMVLSGLAGYFPSRKAAMVDPVESLRAEE